MKQVAFRLTATDLSRMVISLFRAFWQQLKANLFEQIGTALLTPSDLLQAVITDLLFSAFNRIEQGRLISLLQACKGQYATGLFQQVCYSLTKWTGPLLYVNSLSQLGKINCLQQVCDISGRVYKERQVDRKKCQAIRWWFVSIRHGRHVLSQCPKERHFPPVLLNIFKYFRGVNASLQGTG